MPGSRPTGCGCSRAPARAHAVRGRPRQPRVDRGVRDRHPARDAPPHLDRLRDRAGADRPQLGARPARRRLHRHQLPRPQHLAGGARAHARRREKRRAVGMAHGSGWKKVPGSEAAGANGIEISNDGKWYYVAAWGSQSFFRLSRGDGARRCATKSASGFRVDNIRWASDGSLLAAGQTGTRDEPETFSVIVKINPDTLGRARGRIAVSTTPRSAPAPWPWNGQRSLGRLLPERSRGGGPGAIAGRVPRTTVARYRFSEFVLSPRRRVLVRDGRELPLIPRYFDLLVFLVEHRHEAVHRRDIFDRVWSDVVVSDSALSQAIRTIRRTLGDDSREPRFIRTVSRHGYQFVWAEVAEEDDDHGVAGRRRDTAAGGAPRSRLKPSRLRTPFEPLLQRLTRVPTSAADEEDQREAAELLHALGTAEALARLAARPGHARARALLRDARWDAAGAGRCRSWARRRRPKRPGSSSRCDCAVPRALPRRAGPARRWAAGVAGALGGQPRRRAPGDGARSDRVTRRDPGARRGGRRLRRGRWCRRRRRAVGGGGGVPLAAHARARRRRRRSAAASIGLAAQWLEPVDAGRTRRRAARRRWRRRRTGDWRRGGAGLRRSHGPGRRRPGGAARLAPSRDRNVVGLACAAATLALTLAGRALVGGTRAPHRRGLRRARRSSSPRSAACSASPTSVRVSAAVLGTGEGFLFGAGLALGLTRRPR